MLELFPWVDVELKNEFFYWIYLVKKLTSSTVELKGISFMCASDDLDFCRWYGLEWRNSLGLHRARQQAS